MKAILRFQLPATVGSDLAGVVLEGGHHVTRFKPGDAVLTSFVLVTCIFLFLTESRRFRGVTPLSWPALEGGNPDTSAGRCSPTLRRAHEFVSAGGDVLHAGSIPSVVSSPSVCSRLD